MKLFRNARIFTPIDDGRPAAGILQARLIRHDQGALLTTAGDIARVGDEKAVLSGLSAYAVHQEIDCGGRAMVPGFVDPHTHICFAERREAEFELRLSGAPYLEILAAGGGILSSARAVREAGEAALFERTAALAASAMAHGSTTIEIKSGYGLDTDTELMMLRVIRRVGRRLPLDVVPTFLGAHAVPPEYAGRTDDFVEMIVSDMIPAVRLQGIARFCDVFCEKGVFSVEQSRRILAAGAAAGMGAKIHADEVNDLGGAALAAELSAVSGDHLLAVSDVNIARMAEAGVVATLLPATAYSLKKPYARARAMIENGLPVAIATDCNPGSSFTESMPFVIGLAVMNMHMTPAEALVAATLNAACAIGMSGRTGSLTPGKQADFLLLDGESPAILAYHVGVSPVAAVYKRGERVAAAGSLEREDYR